MLTPTNKLSSETISCTGQVTGSANPKNNNHDTYDQSKNNNNYESSPNLDLGPPKGVSIDRLSGVGASAGVCLLPWG